MFCTYGRFSKCFFALAASNLFFVGNVFGEILTTATYDNDSYVHFGTSNETSPELTVGEPLPPAEDPHYNIGFIEFDVSGLSLAGSKFLDLEPNTTTAILPTTVAIAALLDNHNGYFAAPDRKAWLNTNAYAEEPIGALAVSAAGGRHYIDVTDVVNGWINTPSSNKGFAFWRVGGNDFDSPEFYSMNDPGGRGPALNSVPEPASLTIIVMAGLVITSLGARRRGQRNRG